MKSQAEIYYNQGVREFDMFKMDAAVGTLDKVIELDKSISKAYYYRGVAKYFTNNLKGAIQDLDIIIKINPADYSAIEYRGFAKQLSNDFEGALSDFSRMIKVNGVNFKGFYNRGSLYLQLKLYHPAIEDFIKCENLSNSIPIFFKRGLAYFHLNKLNEALQDFKAAGDSSESEALLYYAEIKRRMKEFEEAENTFEEYIQKKSLSVESDNSEDIELVLAALFQKGLISFDLNDFELAEMRISMAIDDLSKVVSERALFFYQKENITDCKLAIEDLSKVIQIRSDCSNAFYLRGYAKFQLSDLIGASEDYGTAVRLNPEGDFIKYS